MTSVPDGQNQDYRRLLALRTSGATPPPSERFLPIAPAPPPANVQPQQQPQPSSASAQGAASNGLITSVGEAYMRRDAPPPSSSYHYRLPPHVAAAYQTQNYDCGASSSSSGSGRSLPHVPADYLSASHYHPAAHSSHYHHPHYNTISHPSHHHGSLHHQHPHHRSPHHHHPDYRRHLSTSQCPGASYLRHSSRSARLEELLNSAAAASNRVPSPRLPPTPSTPRTTPPLQTRSLPSNDSLVDAPALDTRASRRYQQQQAVLEQQQQQQQQQQQSNSRLYQDPSPVPSQQSSRSYQSQQQQQQQSQEPSSSLTGAVQPSRPESRCSISSVAGSASALPLAWRNAVSSAAAAASASVPPCTPPGTSPSGQATPASPSSSSSPSASATSSTASCSSQTCSSVSSVSSAASTIPATTTSSLAPSPPQNPTITPPVPSSPIESTTADTPRVARAVTRTETIKNYIKRGTAEFFGLCENDEDEERLRLRWLERRKRLAVRKCGPLREECAPVAARHAPARQRAAQVASRPDVLPTDSPDHPGSSSAEPEGPRWTEPPVRRKESVARMALGGLGYVITTLTRHRARATSRSREWSRSYSPSAALDPPQQQQQPATPPRLFQDEVFFDKPASISGASGEGDSGGNKAQEEKASSASNLHTAASEPSFRSGQQSGASESLQDDPDHRPIRDHRSFSSDRAHSWRRSRQEPGAEATSPEVGASRIWSHVLDRALDNSDRRQYGMGFVGRMLRRSRKRSVVHRHKRQLDDMEDYRPFFTYWVTTVHVMVMALSLLCYGLGPLGIDLNQRSSLVMVPSLSLQQVDYLEPANFWIGPRAADLIHLGAKFSPCMRKDHRIWRRINKAREKERETACCIRNDDSGCVQSSQAECSLRGLRPTQTISTWKKWSAGESGPGGRISGSVCGLDPKYCELPASIAPFEWPDDITKWPICRKPSSVVQRRGVNGVGTQLRRDKTAEHMVCEVIAHPCCIGIHGSCSITTKEYCDFVRGKFHEEASLCSQVSCLDDVCGMIPFYNPDRPDQFYRLWTSLFLHAGFVHLLLTLVVQLCIMRDVERMTGPLRMAMIYLGSGMGGNLASAIFVPYRAEVGPAGAQFGLLACLMVEVLDVWPMLRRPEQALLKLLAVVALLLLLGLLPWVDNWAHVFGFVFGLLLSSALLPFVTIGSAPFSRHRKRLQVWLCLGGAMLLFLALVAIFYLVPVIDCPLCDLFNCLPITSQFCAEQDINFGRDEIV
ncbi:inactive rhomboid protein 1 isoform X2 [Cloeon dipterum]|uniref:inactive rhomboid protein 1 isoform X2 n=1 Tax=Cloeon dipterum TaxID=197152 RepID=UPI00321FA481